MLINQFYFGILTSVFDASYRALQDFVAAQERKADAQPHLNVVSAPAGGGKTSFSVALIAALVRLTEGGQQGPMGCLFLTDQRERADDTYRELVKLLPGKVAIWTSDHDPRCKKQEKVKDPAARYAVDELERYPAVVTTHSFFKGPRGLKARQMLHQGCIHSRALTIVDERPNEVIVFEAVLSQAEQVREHIQADEQNRDTVEPHVSNLVRFMQDRASLRNRHQGPSIVGFEDKVEQS